MLWASSEAESRKAMEGGAGQQQQLSKCSASPPLGPPLAFPALGMVVGALHIPCSLSQLSRQFFVITYTMLRIRITLTRIRILLVTLMRIRIRIMLVILCGSGSGSCFSLDPDPDPEPSFQIKAQNLEKSAQIGSYSIHFGLLWCGSGFDRLHLAWRIRIWIMILPFHEKNCPISFVYKLAKLSEKWYYLKFVPHLYMASNYFFTQRSGVENPDKYQDRPVPKHSIN